MADKKGQFRGMLLGLAVGDAMGYTIDGSSWKEIQQSYGPNGLLGYDLVNGYADVTSYTQLAAFTCNGLLREWAASQKPWGRPSTTFCWLLQVPEMCRRHCMDTRMLDALSRDTLGAMEARFNSSSTPGSLTSAAAVGLFSHLYKVEQSELDLLGAEVVALSHGSPLAFLSGAALAHIISRSLSAPDLPLKNLVLETAQSLKNQFGHQYSQSFEISNLLNLAVSLAEDSRLNPVTAMEQLHCLNAAQVLSGAVYACLRCGKSFDTAMIAAVNHSGRSAAVGAVAGAILGLRLGEKALPSFYIECQEPAETLGELAEDMLGGCTMERGSKLFDLDWDRKYIHGGK